MASFQPMDCPRCGHPLYPKSDGEELLSFMPSAGTPGRGALGCATLAEQRREDGRRARARQVPRVDAPRNGAEYAEPEHGCGS